MCFLQFTKYTVYRKCFFESSTVLRQFLKIACAKLLSVTDSGTAQEESKQLNRPISNLRINNWVKMDSSISYPDSVKIISHFRGAITPWTSVLGVTSKSIAMASLASKCGHYLLLKILLFQILPQLSHFSYLSMCVKCCVTTQFLIRLLEFYTFIAKIEHFFFFSFLNMISWWVAHVGLEL